MTTVLRSSITITVGVQAVLETSGSVCAVEAIEIVTDLFAQARKHEPSANDILSYLLFDAERHQDSAFVEEDAEQRDYDYAMATSLYEVALRLLLDYGIEPATHDWHMLLEAKAIQTRKE